MFGVPIETVQDAKETEELIKWIYSVNPESNLWTYFYTPRPDTPWYHMAVQLGMKEFTLRDWGQLDKYTGLIYNLSNLTEKQITESMRRISISKLLARSKKKYYTNLPKVAMGYSYRKLIKNPIKKILGLTEVMESTH